LYLAGRSHCTNGRSFEPHFRLYEAALRAYFSIF